MTRNLLQNVVGTQEDYEKYKTFYPNYTKVIPATVYLECNENDLNTKLLLVTSNEWKDFLLGKTDKIPE